MPMVWYVCVVSTLNESVVRGKQMARTSSLLLGSHSNSTVLDPACLPAASPLEGYGPKEWVAFERALVVRDIFTGGVKTFLSTEDAQAFRALIYKQYSELPLCAVDPTLPIPSPSRKGQVLGAHAPVE